MCRFAFKPGKGAFQIFLKGEDQYEPDFVVETKTAKLICEVKAADEITSLEVQEKAKAAVKWCEHATVHEMEVGGKPWAYVLIPDTVIDQAKTIRALATAYTKLSERAGEPKVESV